MKYNKVNDVVYYSFENIDNHGLKTCFSTKHGGVSTGYLASMNLSRSNGDNNANVDKNYDILCEAVGLNRNKIVAGSQTHSNNVRVVSSIDIGSKIENNDGLITNEKGLVLATSHADCVPVFFYDKNKEVIAMVHSGWKSTLGNISKNTIRKMIETFDTNPKDVLVGIGASICYECFEVEDDVLDLFLNEFDFAKECYKQKNETKYLIDLKKIIVNQLINERVLIENIDVTDVCTMCTEDTFFSHRLMGTKRGSQMAFIQM